MTPTTRTQNHAELLSVLLFVVAPIAAAFVAAVLLVRYNGISVWKLVGDPAAATHTNPLLGFFSNLGILGWCSGAAVAIFTSWLLSLRGAASEAVRFHLVGGLFTAVLMADDFFLIHDELAQRYLGLPQNAVYAIYATLFLFFLVRCRREILDHNPRLFVVAVFLLGFMALIDAFGRQNRFVTLAMTGSKLLGIFAWAAYFWLAARRDILTTSGSRAR